MVRLLTLLLLISAVLLFVSRYLNRQLKLAAGQAYRDGFSAGHIQGWHDATATDPLPQQVAARPPAPWQGLQFGQGPVPGPPAQQPFIQLPAFVPPKDEPVFVPPRDEPAAAEPTMVRAAVEESPEELLARKEKRERQNINVTLYVASLLLVAAGALFVGTSLPAGLRFAGVCLITVFFYGAGLALHAHVPRLRPAAVAFAGTGLALVPVAGLAMYYFAVQNGPLAWLLTSVVGTVAYIAAAIRLESRVLVYLSLHVRGIHGVVRSFRARVFACLVLCGHDRIRGGDEPGSAWEATLGSARVPAPGYASRSVRSSCGGRRGWILPLRLDRGEFALVMALCGMYFAVAAAAPSAGHVS